MEKLKKRKKKTIIMKDYTSNYKSNYRDYYYQEYDNSYNDSNYRYNNYKARVSRGRRNYKRGGKKENVEWNFHYLNKFLKNY